MFNGYQVPQERLKELVQLFPIDNLDVWKERLCQWPGIFPRTPDLEERERRTALLIEFARSLMGRKVAEIGVKDPEHVKLLTDQNSQILVLSLEEVKDWQDSTWVPELLFTEKYLDTKEDWLEAFLGYLYKAVDQFGGYEVVRFEGTLEQAQFGTYLSTLYEFAVPNLEPKTERRNSYDPATPHERWEDWFNRTRAGAYQLTCKQVERICLGAASSAVATSLDIFFRGLIRVGQLHNGTVIFLAK